LGITTITQDVEDFLQNQYGKAIVSNSSIQFLMKQSTASIPLLTQTFYLSEGEKQLLMASDIGEGIFFAGQNHVALRVVASDEEHEVITSNPEEILERQHSAQEPVEVEPLFPRESSLLSEKRLAELKKQQKAAKAASPEDEYYTSKSASPTKKTKTEVKEVKEVKEAAEESADNRTTDQTNDQKEQLASQEQSTAPKKQKTERVRYTVDDYQPPAEIFRDDD
jgi:hypothetical protein